MLHGERALTDPLAESMAVEQLMSGLCYAGGAALLLPIMLGLLPPTHLPAASGLSMLLPGLFSGLQSCAPWQELWPQKKLGWISGHCQRSVLHTCGTKHVQRVTAVPVLRSRATLNCTPGSCQCPRGPRSHAMVLGGTPSLSLACAAGSGPRCRAGTRRRCAL